MTPVKVVIEFTLDSDPIIARKQTVHEYVRSALVGDQPLSRVVRSHNEPVFKITTAWAMEVTCAH